VSDGDGDATKKAREGCKGNLKVLLFPIYFDVCFSAEAFEILG
jgi:hypothetical protein